MSRWDTIEELAGLRADFAIHHALRGFDMEYDEALDLVRTAEDELSNEEKARRNIIVAAIDNLVDFAVAGEYQMMEESLDAGEDETLYEDEDELYEAMAAICKKYNYTYANVENLDIEYAMIVAAQLLAVSSTSMLTYMTQGDERVRPWHLQYEGFSAPKGSFPAWLIPPIEHQCRCYLVEDTISGVSGVMNSKAKTPTMPEWFNPTFKESVALGGRIFSDEHSYFNVLEEHFSILNDISNNLKQKYWN